MNETKLAHRLGELLVQNGQHVIKVKTGDRFTPATNTDASYTVNPRQPGDYDKLFSELYRLKRIPQKIIHLWSATVQDTGRPGLEELDKFLDT